MEGHRRKFKKKQKFLGSPCKCCLVLSYSKVMTLCATCTIFVTIFMWHIVKISYLSLLHKPLIFSLLLTINHHN